MSDASVFAALRSHIPLVVVEAPAGCGKTHQGADYAREIAGTKPSNRLLILTHTHAACSVFADRTKGTGSRVEIRTIDSIIGHIASAYHVALGIPADPAIWIRQQGEHGYSLLAIKVAEFVKRHPMILASLAHRHPHVICDEHQDSSGDQHAIVMGLLQQGALVRIFGDPMQKIFLDRQSVVSACPPCDWNKLKDEAHAFQELDFPHRWSSGCMQLGQWTLAAREALKSGGTVDLRCRPSSVSVVVAENQARRNLQYGLTQKDRRSIDAFERSQSSLLILTRHNQTARSFRGLFNRQIDLWEGHTRSALENFVDALHTGHGDAAAIAHAIVEFMGDVGKGFSPSAFGDRFTEEAREGCAKKRTGKATLIQDLARLVVAEPDHRGAAKMFRHLSQLKKTGTAFADIEIDHHREFWEAVRLGDFDAPQAGLAEITHHRTYSRPKPPAKAISTIHKAKGLDCDSVIVMPCDAKTFPNKDEARCLLYVALSRAKHRLMLIVSQTDPSPLLSL